MSVCTVCGDMSACTVCGHISACTFCGNMSTCAKDNPRAKARGLSIVHVDNLVIMIVCHSHQCRLYRLRVEVDTKMYMYTCR